MGSKVATPGLGFIYAATLGGYLGEMKAGQRAASHISPLIVMKDSRPILALGAAGGSRIPSACGSHHKPCYRSRLFFG
jgi:gamma-glutamyltranspeptidase/glutathione hydrolase